MFLEISKRLHLRLGTLSELFSDFWALGIQLTGHLVRWHRSAGHWVTLALGHLGTRSYFTLGRLALRRLGTLGIWLHWHSVALALE